MHDPVPVVCSLNTGTFLCYAACAWLVPADGIVMGFHARPSCRSNINTNSRNNNNNNIYINKNNNADDDDLIGALEQMATVNAVDRGAQASSRVSKTQAPTAAVVTWRTLASGAPTLEKRPASSAKLLVMTAVKVE